MTLVPRRYTAGWVLPFEGPPLRDGAVLVDQHGLITKVGPHFDVPSSPGIAETALGPGFALLPGLINTHTHLELTGFDHDAPESDFNEWIRRIIELKAARSPADFLIAARQGVRDCWAQGVTTVADTGDSGSVIQALNQLGGSGICYHEVFGPSPDQLESQFSAWSERLEQLGRLVNERVRLGVSPHAPYSVSGPLYRRVAEFAARRGYPIAVHLAESEAESQLIERGTGGFAVAWQGRGIPLPETGGKTPVEWLDHHGVLTPATLCIHMVRASGSDLDLVARRRSAIAHCPRSNRRHGHGAAPLGAMLKRGIRIGVGTDSAASVSPLDLLAEVRAARALGGLTADQALALVTTSAAATLGLSSEIGSLTPGKRADLAAFSLAGPVDAAQLADTLLTRGSGAVCLTVVSGREVYRR